MKTLAIVTAVLLGLVVTIPAVIATGDRPPTSGCGQIGAILATIRTLESGDDYTAKAAGASASGAYQYIDQTWTYWATQAGFDTDQYPTARSAPPAVQDDVAAHNVQQILDEHDGNVDAVPVVWYYPAALGQPHLMDRVPRPDAGNQLTVRQYQTRWLDTYDQTNANPDARHCGTTTVNGDWALPVPIDTLNPATLDDPHHDYPAWDYMTPVGTPIYAITHGTVVTTQHWNGNWWTAGCQTRTRPPDCNTCGNGITIETAAGLRHTYCHNSRLYVNLGDQIAAGQHIADSGNTGRSGGPHLHLQLRLNGRDLCPQPLLTELYTAVTENSNVNWDAGTVLRTAIQSCSF